MKGHRGEYDFDLLVSDDGERWTKVSCTSRTWAGGSYWSTIALTFARPAGGANRVVALSYPIELTEPTAIELTLDARQGQSVDLWGCDEAG